MKIKSWLKLKKGSILRGKSGILRKVLSFHKSSQTIRLKMIRSGCWKLWSGCLRCCQAGRDITTYSSCDKNNFSVVKY